jgi:Phosphotransferase enzyme family
MTTGSVATPELVDTPEQLTPSWLTAALRVGGLDVTVSDVSYGPVGNGLMSSCYRLALDYSRGDGPASLVAKLPSASAQARVGAAVGNLTEVRFYRELRSTVAIRAPECVYGDTDDEGMSFVMLLEDLGPAEPGDQIAGCGAEQARDAVVNLAGLHGPRWCDESLHDLDWLTPLGGAQAEGTAAILLQMTEGFVERFSVPDRDADVLRAFAQRATGWLLGRAERFGFVHGDYRLDNLTFATPRGGYPCATIDWQLLSVGLPARDLGFFLGTGMLAVERAVNDQRLVTAYHGALLRHGVCDYSLDECFEDYRWGLFQGPLITVLGAMFAPPTERGDRMFTAMSERCCAAIRDLDSLSLL